MANSQVPKITDLSEEDRKLALKQTEILLHMLNQCGVYVRDYAAGTQNLYKCFGLMYYTGKTLTDVQKELAKIHKVPTLS